MKFLKDIEQSFSPWWMELRQGIKPHGYKFWRKTKAGKWENIATITNVSNLQTIYDWFETAWQEERLKYSYAALKVTTLNGRQIYSTYYSTLYQYIAQKILDNKMFGLSIDKGEHYLFYHTALPGNNLEPISKFFCQLSRMHKGIKAFHKAPYDDADGNLFWGTLVFNDKYQITVAIDTDFSIYNQYKPSLGALNISHLIKLI